MGETTKISWTDATFNPWVGCSKVSAGCQNCYAEHNTFPRMRRALGQELWGPDAKRQITSDAYWKKPLTWNRKAEKEGVRRRVFCGSLCDVFEDRDDLAKARSCLFWLIAETPSLDWLLLTKRPQHVGRLFNLNNALPPNVWLGVTCENQQAADERIPILLQIPAAVRFLSCEPLLEHIDLSRWINPVAQTFGTLHQPPNALHLVIVGGESGAQARPCNVTWIRSIRDQCLAAVVACFIKQLGSDVRGDWDEFAYLPNCPMGKRLVGCGDFGDGAGFADVIQLVHPKGGDPSEWPKDLRVQQFPEV